jgi:hypothetical protein
MSGLPVIRHQTQLLSTDVVGLQVSLRVGRVPASPEWRFTEFGHVRHSIGVIPDVNPAGDREPAPLLFTVPCNDRAGHLLNLGENILFALAVSPLVRELPVVNAKSCAVDFKSVENNERAKARWCAQLFLLLFITATPNSAAVGFVGRSDIAAGRRSVAGETSIVAAPGGSSSTSFWNSAVNSACMVAPEYTTVARIGR